MSRRKINLNHKILKQKLSAEKMNHLNPLSCVRESCNAVVQQSKSVSINEVSLIEHSMKFRKTSVGDYCKDVEWDSYGWHYCWDIGSFGPLTVQYIFVMDAMNFCFWPTSGFEYDTLAKSLKIVLENDSSAFNAENLANINEVLF